MSLAEKITSDLKEAMKAKDKPRLETLRAIKSALMLEATKEGTDINGIHDDLGNKIMQKLYKQRIDAGNLYKEQNREDLAKDEFDQAAVMEDYLPKQMNEAEIEAAVKEVIAKTGATGPQDIGKVMGMATKQMAGKADGKIIAAKAKELLAN